MARLGQQGQARYEEIQSISYSFGSKLMSGFFTTLSGKCLVRLVVTEKKSWSQADPMSTVRFRFYLHPGQVSGLDSDEGQSLNFTCGEGATALLVDTGSRETLVALEKNSVRSLYALEVSFLGG